MRFVADSLALHHIPLSTRLGELDALKDASFVNTHHSALFRSLCVEQAVAEYAGTPGRGMLPIYPHEALIP